MKDMNALYKYILLQNFPYIDLVSEKNKFKTLLCVIAKQIHSMFHLLHSFIYPSK